MMRPQGHLFVMSFCPHQSLTSRISTSDMLAPLAPLRFQSSTSNSEVRKMTSQKGDLAAPTSSHPVTPFYFEWHRSAHYKVVRRPVFSSLLTD